MKKTTGSRISKTEAACAVYIALCGVAIPLTVHDAYYDITLTKAFVFWLLSGLLIAAAAAAIIFDRGERIEKKQLDVTDLLFAVFALCQIVSTLVFIGGKGVLAADNRYQGVMTFAFYMAAFVILRRHGKAGPTVRFALLLGASVSALVAVTDLFGGDMLSLLALSPAREHIRFTSTIGNISFLSATCVLFLPLAAYLAVSAASLRRALPYALAALIVLCGGLSSREESFILGALVFYALVPLFTSDAASLRRVPLLWAVSALVSLIFGAAVGRFGIYPLSELASIVCSPLFALPVTACAAALFVLLRTRPEATVLKLRKVYIMLVILGVAALVVFTILVNTALRGSIGGTAERVFVFSSSWGSDRGAEWASFWEMFRSAPLPKKLIGGGAGSVADWDRAHRLFSDAVTDSAHNEYLHYLLTCGALGALSYIAVIVLALRRALVSPSRIRTALALSCAAYAAQAAVNIAQPFTTPLFVIILALILSDKRHEDDGPASDGIFYRVALCMLAAVLLIAGSYTSRSIAAGYASSSVSSVRK